MIFCVNENIECNAIQKIESRKNLFHQSFSPMETTKKSSKKGIPKRKFTPDEDKALNLLVNKYGTENWRLIAQEMNGRNPRQCRERWINYVSPKLSQAPWTHEEDLLLVQQYKMIGSRWHKLAQCFPNRSANNILIHFKNLNKNGAFQKIESELFSANNPKNTEEKQIIDPIFPSTLDFDLAQILFNDF